MDVVRESGARAVWAFVTASLCVACGGDAPADPVLYTAGRPSVVMIVIDTVRNDHLGHAGYPRDTSPHLDRLAGQGRLFSRAVAASPWTGPSVASIVTGLYPDELGIRDLDDRLPDEATTLAEVFRDHGWNTAAIVSNGYIAPWFGHAQGYQHFDKEEYTGDDDSNSTPICTADRITDKAIDWLRTAQGPYFLYLHYTDPHEPYLPPQEWRERFLAGAAPIDEMLLRERRFTFVPMYDALLAGVKSMYDASIAFADAEIGRLLEHVPDDALVVVVGDHGEEFLDHGGFLHGHTVFEELVHIPLVFRGPGVVPGRADEPVSHVDIAPTVLSYAGLPPLSDLSGTSLVRALAGMQDSVGERTLFSVREYDGVATIAARRGDWKLIYGGPEAMSLYDLGADPGEQLDLADREPRTAQRLVRSIEARKDRLKEPAPRDSDEEQLKRLEELRSLGYIN